MSATVVLVKVSMRKMLQKLVAWREKQSIAFFHPAKLGYGSLMPLACADLVLPWSVNGMTASKAAEYEYARA
jgi:hypothetical protein